MSNRRIFFLTTDSNTPSGGRLIIYEIVDLLCKNGFQAYALHQKRNFKYTWFKNSTPVCYTYQFKKPNNQTNNKLKSWLKFYLNIIFDYFKAPSEATQPVTINQDDILVLPATRTTFIHKFLPGVPKISLSQGPYLLLECSGLNNSSIYHADIKARIAMSKLNYDLHCLIFPPDTVWHIPIFIDDVLFNYTAEKKHQIAYMPRRLSKDSKALINLLKLRENIDGFTFVPIDGVSRQEVAKILKESLIFMSFSQREGFGLPPAEAMACGCIVIGYSGNGGDEFFRENFCFKIEEGDLIKYAQVVENIINQYLTNPEPLDEMRKQGSDFILQNYSRKTFEDSFIAKWGEIMKMI